MRTNIDIDDELMARAMQAGPYKTKREAVEAGLKLLARQAAYKEILKWRGKLKWEGDESIDWTKARAEGAKVVSVQEPTSPPYGSEGQPAAGPAVGGAEATPAAGRKRRAGR